VVRQHQRPCAERFQKCRVACAVGEWRTRAATHCTMRAYVERRTTEGWQKKEILQCLKRYIARELYLQIGADDRRQAKSEMRVLVLVVSERASTTFGCVVGRFPLWVTQEGSEPSEVVGVQVLLLAP
jgi:hypothetical protein